jgi:hypothetical protein
MNIDVHMCVVPVKVLFRCQRITMCTTMYLRVSHRHRRHHVASLEDEIEKMFLDFIGSTHSYVKLYVGQVGFNSNMAVRRITQDVRTYDRMRERRQDQLSYENQNPNTYGEHLVDKRDINYVRSENWK